MTTTSNATAAAALQAADTIAEHLADPASVAFPDGWRHLPQSLAGGAAGIALLHLERARSGRGSWDTARRWLTAAAQGQLSAADNASLYFGVPTLAFVTDAVGRPDKLSRTQAELDKGTIAATRRRLRAAHRRIENGTRPAMREYDLIAGLTGLGAYHLKAHPGHDVTAEVLTYLVRLTEPLPGATDDLPGWWTDTSTTGRIDPDVPGGHGNTGMSHGIAAPLALLSLAKLRGLTVDGHDDAIARITAWMDRWQQDAPSGCWWPGYITAERERTGHVPPTAHPRPSWCYGTPGTARAIQLAALATGDTARQDRAESAMTAALEPAQLAYITEVGLCHGTAGVLQAAWRMAADARTPRIAAELPRLVGLLLDALESACEPELLDGTAGAALALHTIGTAQAPATGWDTFLLLA